MPLIRKIPLKYKIITLMVMGIIFGLLAFDYNCFKNNYERNRFGEDFNLKKAASDITIHTPENTTYKEPMNGYYPATYGFENDEDDSIPKGWIYTPKTYSDVKVISGKGGHNKVLECYSGSTAPSRIDSSIFYNYQVEGTVEFWWYKSSSYTSAAIIDFWGETPDCCISIRVDHSAENNDKIEYQTGAGYVDTGYPFYKDNKWMHFRIKFNCLSDTYSLWIDHVKYLDNIDFINSKDETRINHTRFDSYNAGNSVLYYVDAVGLSWDPNYRIGDNIFEGLLLGFTNDTTLDWIGYSLDDQANRTILGNTTIRLPEEGSHRIQVFANDTSGGLILSILRYFTIDFPIDIITPEAKTYFKSMSGYYPATYGFENDVDGSMASDWSEEDSGSLTWVRVDPGITGHKKILEFNDTGTTSGQYASAGLPFSAQSNGTIEFWLYKLSAGGYGGFEFFAKSGGYPGTVATVINGDQLDNGNLQYNNGTINFVIGTFYRDNWHHIRIDFECGTGNYKGLAPDTYDIYFDDNLVKDDADFYNENDLDSIDYLQFAGDTSQLGIFYIDALGYSWDFNYEIGDNSKEGMLLSFTNTTNLDWISYSLDGQANRTILGNATIPLPEDGEHIIKIYANDSLGNLNQSSIRHFSLDTSAPEISIHSPLDGKLIGLIAPDFIIEVTDADLDTMWYTIDNGVTNIIFTVNGTIDQKNWTAHTDGSVTLIFYANDTGGSIASAQVIITKDSSAPTFSINSPQDGTYWNRIPKIKVTANDTNLDKIWYSNGTLDIMLTNDEAQKIDESIWNSLPKEAEFTLYIYAKDHAGNIKRKTLTLYKDKKAPNITIYAPGNNDYFSNTPPDIDVNVTDKYLNNMWFSLENESSTPISYDWEGNITQEQWDSVGNGPITVKFYANDKAGNIGFQQIIIRKNIDYWSLSPLIIDELGEGNYTWLEATNEGWCEGSGTSSDPYIIEFISINGENSTNCLEIRNSEVYFVIRNCKFYNGSFDSNYAGIKLFNVENGKIDSCSCSYNNYYGIYLESSNDNEITGNTINNNGFAGIGLNVSDNNDISNNLETINYNEVYGIYLTNSDYNTISRNSVNHNSIGIYLNFSNNNEIKNNILNDNEQGIVISENCKGNILSLNEVSNEVFISLVILIVVLAMIGGATSGILVVYRKPIKNLIKPKEKKITKPQKKVPTKPKRPVKPQEVSVEKKEVIKKEKRLPSKPKKRTKPLQKSKIKKAEASLTPKKLKKAELGPTPDYITTAEDLAEKRKVESEVDIEEHKIVCVVHRGAIDGAIYVCPNCKSYYCIRCANVLIDKEENCWVCENEIMLKKPEIRELEKAEEVEYETEGDKIVFLSYSTLDSQRYSIPEIAASLEKYPEVGNVLFWEVDSGESVVDFMEQALTISNVFILFCSENSKKSQAVKGEWQAAYQLRKKGKMKIVPVYDNEEDVPKLLLPLLNVKYSQEDFEGFIEKLYEEILRKETI